MIVRAALVVMLMLCAAAAAEARVRSLDVVTKEPCPQAMMLTAAQDDGPIAPVQATTAPRAGCSCQGESDKCACSGQSAESCCCSTKTEESRPAALTLPKRVFKRRLHAAKAR
jgi:hypothetical protein